MWVIGGILIGFIFGYMFGSRKNIQSQISDSDNVTQIQMIKENNHETK